MLKKLTVLFLLFSCSMVDASTLWEGAKASLEANLEVVGNFTYLTAGRHQFRSLWSRDFCFSVRGLLLTGHSEVVRDQLNLLLENSRDEDGLVPRTLDSISAQWRVTRVVLSQFFPWLSSPIPIGIDLKPEYVDENKPLVLSDCPIIMMKCIGLGCLHFL